jgi:hypothetical protein
MNFRLFKSIPGGDTFSLEEPPFRLYTASIMSLKCPENGFFDKLVWARSPKEARQIMEKIFLPHLFNMEFEVARIYKVPTS